MISSYEYVRLDSGSCLKFHELKLIVSLRDCIEFFQIESRDSGLSRI